VESRRIRSALLTAFAAALAVVWLSTLGRELWEDGYFVKRFAYNFWRHHEFSWNIADGPVYAMTSQTLQALGAVLYRLAPAHLVITLKTVLFAALFFTLLVLGRFTRAHGGGELAGLIPCAVGLSMSLILEVTLSGLETPLALLVLAAAIAVVLRPAEARPSVPAAAVAVLTLYLTRPDAIVIPSTLLIGQLALALRKGAPPGAAALAKSLAAIGAGLAVLLVLFRAYYGTALPLPFYVKTHGLSVQSASHIAVFAPDKFKNVVEFVFLLLPLVYIALHDRSRSVLLLLLSALLFVLYHLVATIETMGLLSRFYLPAVVPTAAAAGLAYRGYQERNRWQASALFYAAWLVAFVLLQRLDRATHIQIVLPVALYLPFLVASAVLLFTPARLLASGTLVIGLTLLAGVAANYRLGAPAFENDEAILLRQIGPRMTFRGLKRLRDKLDVKVLYHSHMGAPGVLFPEAKVVDLDGLLNEDITLRGARFEELCHADRPEAIYMPNDTYPELRAEVSSSACFRDYRPAVPGDGSPLYIRADLLSRYQAFP
jgi:hypothetical protein